MGHLSLFTLAPATDFNKITPGGARHYSSRPVPSLWLLWFEREGNNRVHKLGKRGRAIERWNVINIWREIESNRTGNGLLTSLPASIINQLFLILNNLVPHPQTFSCIYIEKSVCSGGRSFEPLVVKLSFNVQEFFNERFNGPRTIADFPTFLYFLHRSSLFFRLISTTPCVPCAPEYIPFTSRLCQSSNPLDI